MIIMESKAIREKIYTVRGFQVMIDRDLADLYQVETKVLNQACKRNKARFPVDFVFQITEEENMEILRSQTVTSNKQNLRGITRHSRVGGNLAFLFNFTVLNPIGRYLSCDQKDGVNMKIPCVYILTNKYNGTLYVGVTLNLVQRVDQHKKHYVKGFSEKYKINRLIYYERHESMYLAITREKQIKKWRRRWKLRLIEEMNPQWRDLSSDIYC